jgi:hypothetical protein
MLGIYQVAEQLVASRAVLSSTELVSLWGPINLLELKAPTYSWLTAVRFKP